AIHKRLCSLSRPPAENSPSQTGICQGAAGLGEHSMESVNNRWGVRHRTRENIHSTPGVSTSPPGVVSLFQCPVYPRLARPISANALCLHTAQWAPVPTGGQQTGTGPYQEECSLLE